MSHLDIFVPAEMWTINRERRLHHMARANLVAPVLEAACLIATARMRDDGIRRYEVPVRVEFFPFQAQRGGTLADTANHLPPCKAALDGFVKAGLLHADTPRWVTFQGFHPPKRSKRTGVGVRVIVDDALPSPAGADPSPQDAP